MLTAQRAVINLLTCTLSTVQDVQYVDMLLLPWRGARKDAATSAQHADPNTDVSVLCQQGQSVNYQG